VISPEPPLSALAGELLARYFDELAERLPTGFDASRTGAPDATELTPPAGVLLVARVEGRAVGCGAVRKLDADRAEIKRMWVDRGLRGLGIGRLLLRALEQAAGELGAAAVYLDTAADLTEALALYRSAGYAEIAAYNDNPYAAHWFAKPLR
jgi:ribosomal protein S18 acetylase RimI-like enzyme